MFLIIGLVCLLFLVACQSVELSEEDQALEDEILGDDSSALAGNAVFDRARYNECRRSRECTISMFQCYRSACAGARGVAKYSCLAKCIDIALSENPVEPVCGNGIREEGEPCDGNQFPENRGSCVELGYEGGELTCTDNCQVDVSECLEEVAPQCEPGRTGNFQCIELEEGFSAFYEFQDEQCNVFIDDNRRNRQYEYCGRGECQEEYGCCSYQSLSSTCEGNVLVNNTINSCGNVNEVVRSDCTDFYGDVIDNTCYTFSEEEKEINNIPESQEATCMWCGNKVCRTTGEVPEINYRTNCLQNEVEIADVWCEGEPLCGNYVIEEGEECDGSPDCNEDCTLIEGQDALCSPGRTGNVECDGSYYARYELQNEQCGLYLGDSYPDRVYCGSFEESCQEGYGCCTFEQSDTWCELNILFNNTLNSCGNVETLFETDCTEMLRGDYRTPKTCIEADGRAYCE